MLHVILNDHANDDVDADDPVRPAPHQKNAAASGRQPCHKLRDHQPPGTQPVWIRIIRAGLPTGNKPYHTLL